MIDYYILYRILTKLTTPFKEWDAYKNEYIDENGKILKKGMGKFDVFILNVKKLIEKAPGGKTRLASYLAAMYLLKESDANDERIDDLIENLDSELAFILEDAGVGAIGGGAPTNNIGSGNIKAYEPLLRKGKKPIARKGFK